MRACRCWAIGGPFLNLLGQYGIDLVLIAIPTAPGREIREIVTICERASVPTKIMPGLYEMLGDLVSVNQLRNVQIEDLLRREPVQTDTAAVQRLIARQAGAGHRRRRIDRQRAVPPDFAFRAE